MKALIIVDIQNDFLAGGALEVPQGDLIIPKVNQLISLFEIVVATQDWHPSNHESFASNNPNGRTGEIIDLHGLPQILWPDHCIQNTIGAAFSKDLNTNLIHKVFQKGTDPKVDSYSGFFDNGKKNDTGLNAYLQSKGVAQIFVVGLATDYCVKFTALDAAGLGYHTTVISDAVRAVNLNPGDQISAFNEMEQAGIKILESNERSI